MIVIGKDVLCDIDLVISYIGINFNPESNPGPEKDTENPNLLEKRPCSIRYLFK